MRSAGLRDAREYIAFGNAAGVARVNGRSQPGQFRLVLPFLALQRARRTSGFSVRLTLRIGMGARIVNGLHCVIRGNKKGNTGVTALEMNFAPRFALVVCAVLAVALQIRFSIATFEARSTLLFIPFQLKPFTNTIDSVGQSARGVLKRGDELLAVNGRPFTGMSVYRQELRSATRYLDGVHRLPPTEAVQARSPSRWPFRVTVRSGAADARTVNIEFGNCTCGSLSTPQVIWYCILPPAACILLGFIVAAASRSQSALPWLFLAVAVCLSVIAIVPGGFGNWSQVADPLEWRDWFRVPALAYQSFFAASWPAWLLLFAVYCFQRSVSAINVWAVSPIFIVGGFKDARDSRFIRVLSTGRANKPRA